MKVTVVYYYFYVCYTHYLYGINDDDDTLYVYTTFIDRWYEDDYDGEVSVMMTMR